MLQFILGTAGTGKTTLLFEKMIDCVQQGNKAILLVPEQFSFESEKRLFRALGAKDSLQVEVLSFTRLCNNIFRTLGGLAGTAVTPVGKYLLMSVAVTELQDYLVAYKKSAQNTDFLDTLLLACTEFKTAGISPQQLNDYANGSSPSKLTDKLSDLAGIYEAYQALLDHGYLDSDDDIIRASVRLENNCFFGDYHVFVDGFTTFMAGEFELMGHIIAQSPSVVMAMTADEVLDKSGGVGVFSTVQRAIAKLARLAEQSGKPIEEPLILTDGKRFKTNDLVHLSKEFLQPNPEVFFQEVNGISISSGADLYAEVEQTALAISTLVQEKGYRYREIAVVAREHSDYLRAMEMQFGRYGIPFFDDRKTDIETTPLMYGVLAAVDAVRGNFSGESILFLAKSPIMGYEPSQVALLENYHYVWQIKGISWETPFQNNPRGMVDKAYPQDQKNLNIINNLRESIIKPLLSLKKAMAAGIGKEFAVGVYEFLMETSASAHLMAYADSMKTVERNHFLEENAQLWDSLIDVLDIFGEVLGDKKIGRIRLCELFRLAISASEVGSIPQTLDQVLVGSANRIRPWDMKAVFILGANEGTFPPQVRTNGLFSDAERQKMIEEGMEIAPSSFQQSIVERFFAYFAVTLPSEKLFISYAKADLQGRELLPSIIVSKTMELFASLLETQPLIEEKIVGEYSAFSLLANHFEENTVLTATLMHYFSRKQDALLSRMKTAASQPPHSIADSQLAGQLFGDSMRFSPSRIERFHSCPFSYFAQDGLRLSKRKRAEFSPLQSGSLLHHVLQVMVKRHGGKGLDKRTIKELSDECRVIIDEYLASRVEDMASVPTRFKYLFTRLCGTLAQLLAQMGKEFLQSEFEPTDFELTIGVQGDVPPLELVSDMGIPVRVEGIVDRVDRMEHQGVQYIRVVDYKSGGKQFNLMDVMHGINLQMLLYLFTLQEDGEKKQETKPAGVLYMPVLERYLSVDRDTNPEKVKLDREKEWTMSGLLLADEVSLRGMEQNLEGFYIPVKQNKSGGFSAYSSLATMEQMGKLDRKIRGQIGAMADQLAKGKIPALPIDPSQYPTCEYCDYRSVCGYEDGNPVKEIRRLSQSEALDLLEGKDDE